MATKINKQIKQKSVPRKKYLVRLAHNFGFGMMPAGSYVDLTKKGAEHYKSKNII